MTDLATTTGGSLAIRPDQTAWTPDQSAVLQQSGIDSDVTSAELSAFLHLCQRTQLDPFSRQIYLIGRWNGQQRRKVFTPQTSIDGYRVIAHRVIAEHSASLGYEDTLWCDKSGQWHDVWLSDEPPAPRRWLSSGTVSGSRPWLGTRSTSRRRRTGRRRACGRRCPRR